MTARKSAESAPPKEHRKPPTQYSAATASAICDRIRIGVPKKDAAQANAIDERTFYRWLQTHPEFMASVAIALSEFKSSCVAIIRQAAPKDWKAAAWLLERRFPDEFALHVRVDAAAKVREMAHALGLDPDEALAEVERMYRELPV